MKKKSDKPKAKVGVGRRRIKLIAKELRKKYGPYAQAASKQ